MLLQVLWIFRKKSLERTLDLCRDLNYAQMIFWKTFWFWFLYKSLNYKKWEQKETMDILQIDSSGFNPLGISVH